MQEYLLPCREWYTWTGVFTTHPKFPIVRTMLCFEIDKLTSHFNFCWGLMRPLYIIMKSINFYCSSSRLTLVEMLRWEKCSSKGSLEINYALSSLTYTHHGKSSRKRLPVYACSVQFLTLIWWVSTCWDSNLQEWQAVEKGYFSP